MKLIPILCNSLFAFVAKARQGMLCLHKTSFAGRKNNEKLCFEMFGCINRSRSQPTGLLRVINSLRLLQPYIVLFKEIICLNIQQCFQQPVFLHPWQG